MTDAVFTTGNGVPANFNDGTVEVIVNGSNKGHKQTVAGETLGAFLNRNAQAYGVRAFTAYGDGTQLQPTSVGGPATSIQKLEITAKDARGIRKTQIKYLFCL